MVVDAFIILFAVSALYRGREIGFVRQFFSTLGFFGGLFLGASVEPFIVSHAHTPASRSIITLLTTLGCALIFLSIGEYIGLRLKHKVVLKRANRFDNGFGGALNVVTLLLTVWLAAAVIASLPFAGLQSAVRSSRIIGTLNQVLPDAPGVIRDLGHLIDPNGFPQVFIGSEPSPNGNVPVPSEQSMQAAVNRDKDSVVKIEGLGCGGLVEGSGFVTGSNLVATNAHVVAGIRHPFVKDANGTHGAVVIWFDPNLDFAVLRVSNLAGPSLVLSNRLSATGTPAVVLGYPGGGPLTASPAAIADQYIAAGRDIYGHGNTNRDIYEIRARIIPGNSGGPLIAKDGTVLGVIFAESTSYKDVGYALTAPQVTDEINQAAAGNQPVGTGQCAE